jgi:hypothetical protein
MCYEIVLLDKTKDFIDSLEPKMMAKAYRTIQILSEFGFVLILFYSRKIVEAEDKNYESK